MPEYFMDRRIERLSSLRIERTQRRHGDFFAIRRFKAQRGH
jgi:hypothetical protein